MFGSRRLTHVAFVDDVTLVPKKFAALGAMLKDLKDKLEQSGLKVHLTECTAQTTNNEWTSRGALEICQGLAVEFLPIGSGLMILDT